MSTEKMNIPAVYKRKIWVSILLSIVTLGVYRIYWEYLLVKNIKALKNDKTSCLGEMLCLELIPFYFLYWWFTRGKTVKEEFAKHGYSVAGNNVVYLILGIFDLSIVSMAIMQHDFNGLPVKAAEKRSSNIKWKHYINYIVIGLITVVLTVIAFTSNPMGLSKSLTNLVTNAGIAIILATSLSMVVGFLGELSLGHAGFMCVGAYMGGKTAVVLYDLVGGLGLPDAIADPLILLASLVLGGLAAMACGFIIGLPALRLKGDYLAIVTLAFGEIVRIIFLNSGGVFGDSSGFKTPRYDKSVFFIVILVMVLVTLFVIQNLMRSKHGRAITAIRDSEIAAKATGINVTKYKLWVFAIAALFAGIAGVLHSFNTPAKIYADTFDYNYSIEILVMVVLGGMGSINGSIIMATLITIINTALQTQLQGGMAVLKNLIYALILIVMVVYNNAPALKPFREKYNLKNLMRKIFKKKTDPSNVHDDEAKWDRVPTKIRMDEVLSVDIQPNSPYTPDKGSKEEK